MPSRWRRRAASGPGGSCLVIRRAGDWTERLARDADRGRQPTHLFVRSLRGRGFMYHAQTYERALVVATGAGIGPVLPYLLGPAPGQLECLWIGRDHRAAMGDDLVTRVLAGGNVTLIDSSRGRPDVGAHVAARAPRVRGRLRRQQRDGARRRRPRLPAARHPLLRPDLRLIGARLCRARGSRRGSPAAGCSRAAGARRRRRRPCRGRLRRRRSRAGASRRRGADVPRDGDEARGRGRRVVRLGRGELLAVDGGVERGDRLRRAGRERADRVREHHGVGRAVAGARGAHERLRDARGAGRGRSSRSRSPRAGRRARASRGRALGRSSPRRSAARPRGRRASRPGWP